VIIEVAAVTVAQSPRNTRVSSGLPLLQRPWSSAKANGAVKMRHGQTPRYEGKDTGPVLQALLKLATMNCAGINVAFRSKKGGRTSETIETKRPWWELIRQQSWEKEEDNEGESAKTGRAEPEEKGAQG
jgi:hypothetical protein